MGWIEDISSAVVYAAGAVVGQRQKLNLLAPLTASEDAPNERINVSLTSDAANAWVLLDCTQDGFSGSVSGAHVVLLTETLSGCKVGDILVVDCVCSLINSAGPAVPAGVGLESTAVGEASPLGCLITNVYYTSIASNARFTVATAGSVSVSVYGVKVGADNVAVSSGNMRIQRFRRLSNV